MSTTPRRPSMPRTIWALGLVSLLMDLSSEIIHSLLPLFLTVTLGASVAMVGADRRNRRSDRLHFQGLFGLAVRPAGTAGGSP